MRMQTQIYQIRMRTGAKAAAIEAVWFGFTQCGRFQQAGFADLDD
jgi:hypothetical protein